MIRQGENGVFVGGCYVVRDGEMTAAPPCSRELPEKPRYVWGTYGQIMTEELFASKLQQYPEGVGNYADFIQANWVGGRTADCVGLIKGYGWLDAETLELRYGTNGMSDVGANQMYYNATVSGTIDTIPDTPGLAVWHDGHIGVYIGNGEVIEAMGTKYGVVKTQLEGRGWTHWLQVPYISYD